jgi:hypothetical protein
MKHPLVRAKGLLLSGQCLLYKYLTLAPESEHPWPEQLADKLAVQKRRRRRKYRQSLGMKGQSPDGVAKEGVDGYTVADTEGGEQDASSAPLAPDPEAQPGAGEEALEDAMEDGMDDSEEPDPPLDAEEQAALDQQVGTIGGGEPED